ncbi:hypothetical protein PMIN03_007916 [Paraphaeosphaeria minitans]
MPAAPTVTIGGGGIERQIRGRKQSPRVSAGYAVIHLHGDDERIVEIQQTARSVRSDVKLHAIPFGLQAERGPDAIVEHLLGHMSLLLA